MTMSNDQRSTSVKLSVLDCGLKEELTTPSNPTVGIGRYSRDEDFTFSGEYQTLATISERVQGIGRYPEEHFYAVSKNIQEAVKDILQPTTLHQAVSSRGNYLAFVHKQPKLDGYTTPWSESLSPVIEAGNGQWIKMSANKLLEQYEFQVISRQRPLPDSWPDFSEQLAEVFEDRIIDNLDHPVLKRLGIVPADTDELDSDDAL